MGSPTSWRAAAEYVRDAKNRGNVYLMVLPLSKRPERGRGAAGDVAVARWLFTDIDYKEPLPATDAPAFEGCRESGGGELECYYREGGRWIHVRRPPLREVLAAGEGVLGRGVRPVYVVDSGTGYHLYFRLPGEVGAGEFRRAEDGLVEALKALGVSADPQARDPARVLRAPGSINPRSGRECRVVYRSDAFLAAFLADELVERLKRRAALVP
ncbi:MAG: hypothetical protein ACPL2E_06410 [Conexivisphaera sp.]